MSTVDAWSLFKRVGAHVRTYWFKAVLLVALITLTSLLSLISPLILRDLLDNALPNKDAARLNWLALGLFALAALTGLSQANFQASIRPRNKTVIECASAQLRVQRGAST